VYVCIWECSYRLRPSTLPSERVSRINKNQIKSIKLLQSHKATTEFAFLHTYNQHVGHSSE